MTDWYIPKERLNEAFPNTRKWLDKNGPMYACLPQPGDHPLLTIMEDTLKRLEKLENE